MIINTCYYKYYKITTYCKYIKFIKMSLTYFVTSLSKHQIIVHYLTTENTVCLK